MKNFLNPYRAFTDEPMIGDLTSEAVDIRFLDNISLQLDFTGDPVGTFSVEVSNNHVQANGYVSNEGDWVALSLSPSPAATGDDGDIFIDLNQLGACYMRVKYSDTTVYSGSAQVQLSGATFENSSYFLIDAPDGLKWYVWFNVNSAGVDPAPAGGYVGVEVAVALADSTSQIADSMAAAMASITSINHILSPTNSVTFDFVSSGTPLMQQGDVPSSTALGLVAGTDGVLNAYISGKAV